MQDYAKNTFYNFIKKKNNSMSSKIKITTLSPLSLPENTSADNLRRVCCKFREACTRLGGRVGGCGGGGGGDTDTGGVVGGGGGDDVGVVVVVVDGGGVVGGALPDTVLNCN